MVIIKWYKKVVFENYINFTGRAGRKEYWYFSLVNLIIVLFLGVIDRTLDLTLVQAETGAFGLAYNFAVFLPGLAVSVRRLHDIGKSGWWLLILQVLLVSAIFFLLVLYFMGNRSIWFYLMALIILAVIIWWLVLFCTKGDKGLNEYGADPESEFDEINQI